MRARTVAVAVAALVVAAGVGVGGGYAAGRLDHQDPPPAPRPSALDAAIPVPGTFPLPIAKDVPYAHDIDYPALKVGLTYDTTKLRVRPTPPEPGHVWQVKVPKGWKRYPAGVGDPAGTVRWRPANEPTVGGFLVRVLPIIQPRDTPTEARDARKQKFQDAYRDVQVIRLEPDSIWFSYRTEENYKRFNYFAWVTSPGSPYAGFELSVAGRDRDRQGLADLLDTMKRSVTRIR